MREVDINYLAVLTAAIIGMIIGAIWYSPMLFGKAWSKEMGWKPEEMKEKQKGAMKGYMMGFIGSLLMYYVLSHFIDFAKADTFSLGTQAGFWAWLGFIATISFGSMAWEGKSWKLWAINNGYQLVCLIIGGGILAVWA